MDKNNFDELLASVQEMDQIVASPKKASRQFDFPDTGVKALRERIGIRSNNNSATVMENKYVPNGTALRGNTNECGAFRGGGMYCLKHILSTIFGWQSFFIGLPVNREAHEYWR